MDRIADAFAWPTGAPEWLPKVLIIAITLLIPLVGPINGLGWMLASLDRLRAGEERLAPANFSYLGRGARVFVVYLIYTLVLVAVGLLPYIPAIAIAISQNHTNGNAALIGLAVLLNLVAFAIFTLGSLLLTFMLPALILATDGGGIAAGLR